METWTALRLDQLPEGELAVSAGTIAFVGVLYCFLGYRLLKFVLGATGFMLAAAPAAAAAGWLSHGHLIAMAISGVIGGICGATALLFLYHLGVFALGGVGAALAAHHLLRMAPQPWSPWAVLAAACVGGLLALWLERPMLCLATAAIGAWLLTAAGLMAAGEFLPQAEAQGVQPAWIDWLAAGIWLALTLVGAYAQRRRTPRAKE